MTQQDSTPAVKQYADMTEDEINAEVAKFLVLFMGLPGVVGAPMITGAGYYEEVARHIVEAGGRVVADPIKDYEPPTDIKGRKASGRWVYRDEKSRPAETAQERIERMAREEHAAYMAEVKKRREQRKAPMPFAADTGAGDSERPKNTKRRR